MAARSFILDLFQLTHGEFTTLYGWMNMNSTDFFKLRAQCASAPHSTVLASGADVGGPLDIGVTPYAAGSILTGYYIAIAGSDTTLTYAFTDTTLGGKLSVGDGFLPSSINVSGIELPITEFTAVTGAEDTDVSISYILFGYIPPSTNP